MRLAFLFGGPPESRTRHQRIMGMFDSTFKSDFQGTKNRLMSGLDVFVATANRTIPLRKWWVVSDSNTRQKD